MSKFNGLVVVTGAPMELEPKAAKRISSLGLGQYGDESKKQCKVVLHHHSDPVSPVVLSEFQFHIKVPYQTFLIDKGLDLIVQAMKQSLDLANWLSENRKPGHFTILISGGRSINLTSFNQLDLVRQDISMHYLQSASKEVLKLPKDASNVVIINSNNYIQDYLPTYELLEFPYNSLGYDVVTNAICMLLGSTPVVFEPEKRLRGTCMQGQQVIAHDDFINQYYRVDQNMVAMGQTIGQTWIHTEDEEEGDEY